MRLTDADYLHEIFLESAQFDTYKDYSFVLDEIDLSPTIDAVPVRHGVWYKGPDSMIECSECHWFRKINEDVYNFCPHCGADMREE